MSTTNVSPSQWPEEYPIHDGSGSFGRGRPSMYICLGGLLSSSSITISTGVCIILNGAIRLEKGTPPGRQCDVGLSLSCVRVCSRTNAAAAGLIGTSSGFPSAKTLIAYLETNCKSAFSVSPPKELFKVAGAPSAAQT